MNILKINNNKILWVVTLGISLLTLVAGCSGNYGRYKRDTDVQQAFEANQVPPDYKYYYFGNDNYPYVIFGIEPKYEMNSTMWNEVSANTSEFKELIRWIWEDYDYHKFGADILDPAGNKVGIVYTAIRETTFRFGENNQISVIPGTPYLSGGPAADLRAP